MKFVPFSILIASILLGVIAYISAYAWYDHTIPSPEERILTDAHGNVVKLLIYKGTHQQLESIIFSINRFGDESISGHDSLIAEGRSKTIAGTSPMSSLPKWANSKLSSHSPERKQNEEFRQQLVDYGVLQPDTYQLTPKWDGNAAIQFYIDGYQESVSRNHENSHIFFHNVDDYEYAATVVYYSLPQQEQDCMLNFLEQNNYALTQVNIVDESIAYLLDKEDNEGGCFANVTADLNGDGQVSQEEQYLQGSIV